MHPDTVCKFSPTYPPSSYDSYITGSMHGGMEIDNKRWVMNEWLRSLVCLFSLFRSLKNVHRFSIDCYVWSSKNTNVSFLCSLKNEDWFSLLFYLANEPVCIWTGFFFSAASYWLSVLLKNQLAFQVSFLIEYFLDVLFITNLLVFYFFLLFCSGRKNIYNLISLFLK